jgi:hypothetical protein
MADAGALTWAIRRWTVPWHSGTVAGARMTDLPTSAGRLKDRRVAESGAGPGIRAEVPDDSADTPVQETGTA